MSTDKQHRKENKTWWARELPTEKEYEKLTDFIYNNYDEDIYVITHDCPIQIKEILFGSTYFLRETDEFSKRLGLLYDIRNWKHWFCGHLHLDENRHRISLLYKTFYKMEE